MSIQLVKCENPLDIPSAFRDIMGAGEYDVFRFHDDCVYDAGKSYNTYKITANGKSFVLKKYEYPEDYESEVRQYSLLRGLPFFPVSRFFVPLFTLSSQFHAIIQ